MLHKKNLIYTVIFLFFCSLLLTVLGYMYWSSRRNSSVKNISSKPTEKTTNKSLSENPEVWKTYTSTDFTVSMPPHTIMKYGRAFQVLKWDDMYGYIISPEIENAAVPDWYQMEIYVVKNISEGTTKEFLDSYTDRGSIEGTYKEYVNNYIHGYSLTVIQNTYPYKTVVMVKDHTLFVLRVSGQYGTELTAYSQRMLDRIAATFRPAITVKPALTIEKQISFSIPTDWKQENTAGSIPGDFGSIRLISPDSSTKPDYTYTSQGAQILTELELGGSIYTPEMHYKKLTYYSTDPQGGGAPEQVKKTLFAGYPAVESWVEFEGYDHTYKVWVGDNIWTIHILGSTHLAEEKHADEIKSILDSITFL